MHDSLTPEEIKQFISDGFIRINEAFSRDLVDAAQNILWRASGCDPHDSATWTRPVVWLGELGGETFKSVANTPRLRNAFDQLVGAGNWQPRLTIGSFPLRFPTQVADTNDTGWHVDASFPDSTSRADDYLSWRVNYRTQGRALLMLFLFSDVEEHDAPTRIRVGSHLDTAKMLLPYGDAGIRVRDMDFSTKWSGKEVLATGPAGTVYLCHPFLVHAAQVHRGSKPRFMAQPALFPSQPIQLDGPLDALCPVAAAIKQGIEG